MCGSAVWLALRARADPAVRLLTVTAYPGLEGGPPSISPDGNFIVFAWTGPNFRALGDLYVKDVEGNALRRLTETPLANEVYPVWSPDGRQIAFARVEGEENRGIYVMSALGGAERKIVDWGWRAAWLPDSRSLIISRRTSQGPALAQHALDTGAERPLTTPPAGFGDVDPKVSPDGTRVAFVRSNRAQGALFVVPVAGGEPVQVDEWARSVATPDWTPDGRDLLHTRWDRGGLRIYRVAATGGAAVLAPGLPSQSFGVSVSQVRPDGTFRVAAVDARSDMGMRLIDLATPPSNGRISAWTPFCDSTRIDWPARFSRDGARVAFTSDRHGPQQILVATREGADARPVTPIDAISVGLASWAPDGRALVFDAVGADHLTDLFTVNTDGGPPRRLTHDDASKSDPEWARDGRWIYYTSNKSGRSELWKIPATGGTPINSRPRVDRSRARRRTARRSTSWARPPRGSRRPRCDEWRRPAVP